MPKASDSVEHGKDALAYTGLSEQERRRVTSLVRLRLAFTLIVTLVVASLLGLVFLLVSHIFGELTPSIRSDLIWKARRGAAELAKAAEYGIALRDEAVIRQVLEPYIKDRDVKRIVVVDADGSVIFSHGEAQEKAPDPFVGHSGTLSVFPSAFASWSKSEIEGGVIGRVAVVVSTERLHAGGRLKQQILLVFGAGALLALIATLGFVRLHVGPVIRVTQRALQELEITTKRALEALRLKSEFIANVSHEIRTPMNGVLGMIELLQQTQLNDRQRKYASTLRSSANALMDVLNDVLDFAKLEAGKAEVRVQPCRPAKLVDEVVDLFQAHAELKGLRLSIEVDANVPARVRIDASRMRQILSNFLGNAIKFTDRGRISVLAHATPTSETGYLLRFVVKDTGIGIPEEALTRLFVPFSQVDGSTTRKYGGTGLGLVICRSLAKLMNGEVGVSSRLGDGSEFWVEVPVEAVDSTSKSSEKSALALPQHASPSLSPDRRILVAEDNPVNCEVLREMLTSLGWSFDLVHDGAAAIQALETGKYALVLMDCQMPMMDGYEASRRIRRNPKLGNSIPIIAVTAHATTEDRDRAIASGMNDHLVKPYTIQNLSGMLGRWMCHQPNHQSEMLHDGAPMPALSSREECSRVPSVINAFITHVPAQIARIGAAIQASDAQELKNAAHKLKGSCGIFGATRMAELCRRLESDLDGAPLLHTQLVAEYEVVYKLIEREKARPSER